MTGHALFTVLIEHKKVSKRIHKKTCTDDLKGNYHREYIKDMHYFYI